MCKSSARGKLGLCPLHSDVSQDERVHGGNVSLGPLIQDPKRSKSSEKMKEVVVANGSVWDSSPSVLNGGDPVSAPEGRVRGGNMMAMLMGSSGFKEACFAPAGAIGF